MTPQLREARIDLDSVRQNLALLGSDYRVDLSGNAYGHGFETIAAAALDAGVATFVVSRDSDEEALRQLTQGRAIRVTAGHTSRDAAALYGIDGSPGLLPVMRVSARVISVKRVAAGQPVSYGYTWRAPRDSTLALTAIGYADGVSRRASNHGTAYLRGPRPIVGRIAMDVLSLDFGDDAIAVGEEAWLFGHEPGSTEAWADALGVPPLSITAGVGHRVPRVYHGGGS